MPSERDERLDLACVLVEIGEPYGAEEQLAAVLEERPDDLRALDLLANGPLECRPPDLQERAFTTRGRRSRRREPR